MMLRGQFITIEGGEGAGKTTIKNCITHYLQQQHIPFICTREPGGTKLAERIRELLLNHDEQEKLLPITELLLMFAARAQHLSQVIIPALEQGQWVVCDRFIDASYAYQGGGRQLKLLEIELLDNWVVGECYPQLTFLLDIPPAQGFQRIRQRSIKDRIEEEDLDFFERVRNTYLQRAQYEPARIKVINASEALSNVEQQVINQLAHFIKQVQS